MNKKQVLILDCNGQAKPTICFHLEVAGFDMRVVTDEDEAINLLSNSRLTGENFSELVINNPYLNVDIAGVLEAIAKIGIEIPVVFVKQSQSLRQIVQSLQLEYRQLRIFHIEPTGTVDLLLSLRSIAATFDINRQIAT